MEELDIDLDLDLKLDLDLNILGEEDEGPPPAAADPMAGYVYTGDFVKDTQIEMSATKAAFIARAKAEAKRRERATDSEYWVCLCFQSRQQVEAFLTISGWGLKTDKYLDGQKIARKLAIAIPIEEPQTGKPNIDRTWADLSLEVTDAEDADS